MNQVYTYSGVFVMSLFLSITKHK